MPVPIYYDDECNLGWWWRCIQTANNTIHIVPQIVTTAVIIKLMFSHVRCEGLNKMPMN